MNHVRRVSRKYAELYNRPDHVRRVEAQQQRRKAIIRKAANQQMIAENPAPKPTPDMAKARGRFTRVKNFFRRGQR